MNIDVKEKPGDVIFVEYLLNVKDKTNSKYFYRLFKFILLFREAMNYFKDNEKDEFNQENNTNYLEYTEYSNLDGAPEICNDFVTEFLENAGFFGMTSEDEKIEIIEQVQHFCFFLYEKGYTVARLTLMNN